MVEIAYSGGKDSDVILQLAKEAGLNYRAIYKNTTIDPPGTSRHAREMEAEVVMPKLTFFQLIEKNGLPSRFYRFCCSKLKEYQYDKAITKCVMGIRKDESKRRSSRYNEPTQCMGTKKYPYEAIYPILEWTQQDVLDFIQDRGIRCAPVYYDENDEFHVERRLGCLCCPLQSRKTRVQSFKRYPRMLRAYIRAAQKYLDSHPDSKTTTTYRDAYAYMYRNMFLDSERQFSELNNSLFGRPDFKSMLENEFNINLTI